MFYNHEEVDYATINFFIPEEFNEKNNKAPRRKENSCYFTGNDLDNRACSCR